MTYFDGATRNHWEVGQPAAGGGSVPAVCTDEWCILCRSATGLLAGVEEWPVRCFPPVSLPVSDTSHIGHLASVNLDLRFEAHCGSIESVQQFLLLIRGGTVSHTAPLCSAADYRAEDVLIEAPCSVVNAYLGGLVPTMMLYKTARVVGDLSALMVMTGVIESSRYLDAVRPTRKYALAFTRNELAMERVRGLEVPTSLDAWLQ